MPADLILYAVIAAGLVLWLKNILGTRHGDERQRPNPFTSAPETEKSALPLPKQQEGMPLLLESDEEPQKLPRNAEIMDSARQGLNDIERADHLFDLAHFMQGAEGAFVMIVEAFAKGDKQTLKDFLSPAVYQAFAGVIDQRINEGESVTTEIHSVRKMEVKNAFLRDRNAFITIQFTAEETCVIRDKEGIIVSGNPDKITEMKDIWVFSRDVKSKDPTWILVETRDGEVEEDGKTPLPEIRL